MMSSAVLAMVLSLAPADAPDTVVVCPAEYLEALRPWAAHRQGQGHRFTWVSSAKTPAEIRAAIRQTAALGALRYVVLIGDAEPAADWDAALRARCVPTHFAKAKVNVRWGSEPEIATDNNYADLDDDGVPDLAVGRLTVDSAQELAVMVRKILEYEQAAGHGTWRRQINCVAGVGGFGPLADSLLEMATKKFLTDEIPPAFATSMTYGSWRSPYCPDPRRFRDAAVARLNEGCLFWVYIGHGQRTVLDQIRVPGGIYPIFDTDDTYKLRCAERPPIAVFLACYTGAFDQPRDCLAEEMLRTPGGPVAVLAGSRVTMPYAMAVMGSELLDQYFRHKRQTVGEVLLHAKRQMVARQSDSDPQRNANRQLLDAIAAAISPSADQLADERAEHVLLFNLFGDPLMRVAHPQEVTLNVAGTIDAGRKLAVSGISQTAGQCTLELVCRRDRMTFAAPVRQQFESSDSVLAAFNDVYRKANDPCWDTQRFTIGAGEFRAELTVPEDARGPCHVRAFVEGGQQFAVGSADIFIRRPAATTSIAAE